MLPILKGAYSFWPVHTSVCKNLMVSDRAFIFHTCSLIACKSFSIETLEFDNDGYLWILPCTGVFVFHKHVLLGHVIHIYHTCISCWCSGKMYQIMFIKSVSVVRVLARLMVRYRDVFVLLLQVDVKHVTYLQIREIQFFFFF
jgi:hypothetical protein